MIDQARLDAAHEGTLFCISVSEGPLAMSKWYFPHSHRAEAISNGLVELARLSVPPLNQSQEVKDLFKTVPELLQSYQIDLRKYAVIRPVIEITV